MHQGAKDKWQLEVPEHVTVPKDYNITSKKKGFRRYWTDFITTHLREINDAEADMERREKDQMRLMFGRFDTYRCVIPEIEIAVYNYMRCNYKL